MRIQKRSAHHLVAIVVALTIIAAGSVVPAIADPVFPLVIPLGDIPSARVTVLGQGPVTTPGLEDAELLIDAQATLALPQFVLDEGAAVQGCSPGYTGVIAVSATGTSAGGTIHAIVLLSGTRTDAGHTGEAFEAGASGYWVIPATEVLPSTQLLSLCVALEPYVSSGSDHAPSPSPTPEASVEPTGSPTPSPTPSPTTSPTPSPSPATSPDRYVSVTANRYEISPGDTVVFGGRVKGAPGCREGQAVALRARQSNQGDFHALRSTTTDESGYFRFETVVGDAREFLVVAPQTGTCPYAESGIIALRSRKV